MKAINDQPYDVDFKPTVEYLASMPDLQNGDLIKGANRAIEKVGISNIRLPLSIRSRKPGKEREIEVSIIGTVSLEANKKGINMSRIIRSLYPHASSVFDINRIKQVLTDYKNNLDSFNAHILFSFDYPIWQTSLRSVDRNGSKNGGWQYYKVTLDCQLDDMGIYTLQMHLDFIYSSSCPCSTELSIHAMETRGKYAIPHSQRSVARVSIETQELFWIEDLVSICQKALVTETQVFVKREDEQAFAELNASNTKFVEDAVRLLADKLEGEPRIRDYKVIASHNESLHNHDAIGVLVKGKQGGFTDRISVADLKSLVY